MLFKGLATIFRPWSHGEGRMFKAGSHFFVHGPRFARKVIADCVRKSAMTDPMSAERAPGKEPALELLLAPGAALETTQPICNGVVDESVEAQFEVQHGKG